MDYFSGVNKVLLRFLSMANYNQATMIACGESNTLVLTARGKLYSWGRGDLGVLAMDSPPIATKHPVLIEVEKSWFCGS